jgi:hypothetical protein
MEGVRVPIFLRLGNRGRGLTPKVAGSLEDVSISNVMIRGSSFPSSVTGVPGYRVRRVNLEGIHAIHTGGVKEVPGLTVDEMVEHYPEGNMWGVLPAWGLYVRHVDGLNLRNFDASWSTEDQRPAAVFDDVADLTLDGFRPASAAGPAPLLWLNNAAGALIRGSRPAPSALFLRVSGQASRGIVFTGNDWSQAQRPYELQGADAGAITSLDSAGSAAATRGRSTKK